ncbi:MAG TPA: hypothetical protein VLJ42_09410 [Solirubrobacteraceae bacterium]|nr:hypothetical protein [Solirubrobacteraceae bacterium]
MAFRVTMMLADAAQAVDNKLYIIGGGWSITGPDPAPSAIAIQIKVPWDEANQRHRMRLELLDTDGANVMIECPTGDEPIVVENDFEVGRPPGIKPGTPIELGLALNIGPLPLEPGNRYEWRLHIGADTREEWTLPFSTREQQPTNGEPASSSDAS